MTGRCPTGSVGFVAISHCVGRVDPAQGCRRGQISMAVLANSLQFITTFVFGIFIGALVAEGALLVPFWKSLTAEEFHKLHPSFGPRLYRFYAPLTISATVASLANLTISIYLSSARVVFSSITAACAIAMILIYFYYFQNANAQFAKGSLNEKELSELLASWEKWHWSRVSVGIIGFGCLVKGGFVNG